MEKLFNKTLEALGRKEAVVLCSIIASSGSTPRGSGAKLVVLQDGSTLGTIGGGAVEYESVKLAREALKTGATFTHGFNLTPNQTADIGMICGGQVVVYFQYFSGKDPEALALFGYISDLFAQSKNSWLISQISDGGVRQMGVYETEAGLRFANIPMEDVAPLLCSRGVLKKGEPAYYVEPLTQAGLAYVFGGGHVSQEVVPVIAHIGFRPVVYEDRENFATAQLFPDAVRRVTAPFTEISRHLTIGPDDYVIIMTRGHQADYEVLEQALRSPAAYIGVIGSRGKIAATTQRLLAAGIPQRDIDRMHTPIGLDIQAETPAEIAISVAAELIAHRAGRKAKT